MHIHSWFAPLLLSAFVMGCGYQSAPKPPGADSISVTQADGIPPILTDAQLQTLSLAALRQRAVLLDRASVNARTAGNSASVSILNQQLQATRDRILRLSP